MRVDALSISEAPRTTTAPSLSTGARQTGLNFSDALARSAPPKSTQLLPRPSTSAPPSPRSDTSVSRSAPAFQAAQPAVRPAPQPNANASDVRSASGTQPDSSGNTKADAESNLKSPKQSGMNLTSMSDAQSNLPPSLATASAAPDVVPNSASSSTTPKAKSGAGSVADSKNAALVSSAVPQLAPQTSAHPDSLAATLAPPVAPPVMLPPTAAPPPSGAAFVPLASADALPSGSRSGGVADTGLSVTTPAAAKFAPPASPSTSLTVPSLAPFSSSSAASASPSPAGANAANLPASSNDAESALRRLSPATASSSEAPFSPTSDSTALGAFSSASDSSLGSIRQPIPASGVPELAANAALDDSSMPTGPALPGMAVPNNPDAGDAPHLHSEPAPPASVFPSPIASADNFPLVPVTVPVAAIADSSAGPKLNDAASARISLTPLANDVAFELDHQVAAPVAVVAQMSTTTPTKIKQPVDSRSANFVAQPSFRDSVGAAGSQTKAIDISSSQPPTGDNAAPQTTSSSSAAFLANAAAANAASATANSAPESRSSDAGSASTTATAPIAQDIAQDGANAAQASSSAGVSAASSLERKSGAESPQTASSASVGPAHDTAATSSLMPPAPPQNVPAPAASAASEKSGALPPAHQMLDSAPAAPLNEAAPAPSAANVTPDSALQMHVGIRTSAFGSVEIHTIIEQSQVGIAIHGDRDLARWFGSEVSGLEAGLKSQHLNLMAVDFASNRSGVQTATSFQQGQPRQTFSRTPGSYAAALPSEATAPEPENKSDITTALPALLPQTRVSILV